MTREEKMIADPKYFAGLFDGEGCISIHNPSRPGQKAYFLHMRIRLVYRPTIEVMPKYYGGSHLIEKRSGNRRTIHTWHIYGNRQCRCILKTIYPFLCEKREQVQFVLSKGSYNHFDKQFLSSLKTYEWKANCQLELLNEITDPQLKLIFEGAGGAKSQTHWS